MINLCEINIKENGTVSIEFNEDLLHLMSEEELVKHFTEPFNNLLPSIKSLADILKERAESLV